MNKITIYKGNCLETLKKIEDESINTCITSPPYFGLRDYGVDGQFGLENTIDEFINNLVNVFKEVKRVLRSDGTLWLNLGDSYNAMNGKGFNTNKDKGHSNRSQEMQKKYGNISNHTNMIKNIGLKPKNLLGVPWRVALALQQDGWYLRQDIIWHKPNPMPESVKDRCTKSHEYIFLLSKNPKYYYDNEAIKEDCITEGVANSPNKIKPVDGVNGSRDNLHKFKGTKKKNKRSVWKVSTKPFKDAHFATFPMDLIEPCVLAGCPEGGTVLDPFSGSGTTGIVATNHKRNSILCELSNEYIKIAKKRIAKQTTNDYQLKII
jgi:DNA modification methylase